jgi:hypothetical protein
MYSIDVGGTEVVVVTGQEGKEFAEANGIHI